MNPISRMIEAVDAYGDAMKRWPDPLLSALLLAAAALLVYVALRGTTAEKAVALAWTILP